MEFLNVLSREEMKNVKGEGNECSCTHNGCEATLVQNDDGWTLTTCDDTWNGDGQYGGTICDGHCPRPGSNN